MIRKMSIYRTTPLSLKHTFYLLLFLWLASSSVWASQTCLSEKRIPSTTPNDRFTVNSDGTVTDDITGLTWTRCPLGLSGNNCQSGQITSTNWMGALQSAKSATIADYVNWRLPNANELESIVEERCNEPAINLAIFPNTPASRFWTSSPHFVYTDTSWTVNFDNGAVTGGRWAGTTIRDLDYHVRLVCDSCKKPDLTDVVIIDDLMWQKSDDGITRKWVSSKQYCDDLVLAGHDDWRSPTVHELRRLVVCTNGHPVPLDVGKACYSDGYGLNYRKPTIDTAFSARPSNYWSSTQRSGTLAGSVEFADGQYGWVNIEAKFYSRCVRNN